MQLVNRNLFLISCLIFIYFIENGNPRDIGLPNFNVGPRLVIEKRHKDPNLKYRQIGRSYNQKVKFPGSGHWSKGINRYSVGTAIVCLLILGLIAFMTQSYIIQAKEYVDGKFDDINREIRDFEIQTVQNKAKDVFDDFLALEQVQEWKTYIEDSMQSERAEQIRRIMEEKLPPQIVELLPPTFGVPKENPETIAKDELSLNLSPLNFEDTNEKEFTEKKYDIDEYSNADVDSQVNPISDTKADPIGATTSEDGGTIYTEPEKNEEDDTAKANEQKNLSNSQFNTNQNQYTSLARLTELSKRKTSSSKVRILPTSESTKTEKKSSASTIKSFKKEPSSPEKSVKTRVSTVGIGKKTNTTPESPRKKPNLDKGK